jgi:hypothetical protein
MNAVSSAFLAAAVSGCLRIHVLQGVDLFLTQNDLFRYPMFRFLLFLSRQLKLHRHNISSDSRLDIDRLQEILLAMDNAPSVTGKLNLYVLVSKQSNS